MPWRGVCVPHSGAEHLQSCYLGIAQRIFVLLRLVSSEQEALLQQRAASDAEDATLDAALAQWEACNASVYDVLNNVSQLLTISEFVTIVSELLRHDDPQVRQHRPVCDGCAGVRPA